MFRFEDSILSTRQEVMYQLSDLYLYIRPFGTPLESPCLLSRLGDIIRQYVYQTIEFKRNVIIH